VARASSLAVPSGTEIADVVSGVLLASFADNPALEYWVNYSNGLAGGPAMEKGDERKIEPPLPLGHDNFAHNCRAGGHSRLDHDQSQKGLHDVRADVHPIRNLRPCSKYAKASPSRRVRLNCWETCDKGINRRGLVRAGRQCWGEKGLCCAHPPGRSGKNSASLLTGTRSQRVRHPRPACLAGLTESSRRGRSPDALGSPACQDN